MKTTSVLLRWLKPNPGGHLWRGKHRLYRQVTPEHVRNLKAQFDMEEENMFYLRHPYLTIEQSCGHAKELKKHEQYMQNKILQKKKWREHQYLADRFGFLMVTDRWE